MKREPDVGTAVKRQIETVISFTMRMTPENGPTRGKAARFVLAAQPNWYPQTPEGEYLQWIADTEEAKEKESL